MYVSAEKGGGAKAVANKTSIDSWEEVCVTTVSDQPGKVNIVGSKGNYLSVGPGGGQCMFNKQKAGE